MADIMLTCRRAGIDVTQNTVQSLSRQPTFLPAFAMRTGGINLMNAANCAGLGHWGDHAFMPQTVSPESAGMVLNNELTHLHNLGSIFDASRKTPSALILAGKSYREVFDQLQAVKPSARHGKKGFCDFSEVWRKTEISIHLLS